MITLHIDNHLELTGDIPTDVEQELKKRLTMENPLWVENNNRGYSNWKTTQELTFYKETPTGLQVPRGYMVKGKGYLRKQGVQYQLEDRTRVLPEVEFGFQGTLWEEQQHAADKILKRRFVVAQMPTGSGKTVVALYVIAQRKQPALVVVHTRGLLYQWQQETLRFLDFKVSDIGLLGDGHEDFGKPLTIASVRSLYNRTERYRKQTGFLIVDECHRVPANTYLKAVSAFDSKFMLGLSATPQRSDGLARLIYLSLGDRVYKGDHKKLQASGHIMAADLVVRETDFNYPYADDYSAMITALTADPDRNQLIADDVVDYAHAAHGPALVVSDRKEHCKVLAELIGKQGVRVAVLTGDTPKKQRGQITEELNAGELDVLVSTIQLTGEGFNCKRLAALFLATPSRYSGKLKQVVGRILRSDDEKQQPVVYDYVDQVGVLWPSYNSRMETYRSLGIAVPN